MAKNHHNRQSKDGRGRPAPRYDRKGNKDREGAETAAARLVAPAAQARRQDDLGEQQSVQPDRAAELDWYLRTAFAQFSTDSTNPLFAFDGLSYIAAYHWADKEPSPEDSVAVPWWVIDVIAAGYQIYWDAALEGRSTTLGQAYGIESHGQGKQRRIATKLHELRDYRIALAVADIVKGGRRVEGAIAAVASEFKLGESTVWRAWRRSARALAGTLVVPTIKTSGSDDSDV